MTRYVLDYANADDAIVMVGFDDGDAIATREAA